MTDKGKNVWACCYGNAAVNKNIHDIYVIWFQQKFKWFRFKDKVKDSSFTEDAYLNARHNNNHLTAFVPGEPR